MTYALDLDAQRREVQYPDGIPVRLRGEQFLFPAELPAKALDPLLSDDLDLLGLLRDVLEATENPTTATIVELIFKRPHLPRRFINAVYAIHRLLLGDDEYERLEALNPSFPDYVRLTTGLARVYGVDLGKLLGLGSSSENGGETSSSTSAGTTDSTPEASGVSPANAASSV
ncbi:hypothetical protein ACO0M4_09925 [Streptomyces sp. RGM 3693]|uniref:hypothetical protein n=1 Tax=Streptomyces sp. RGM 3693 TaxID=3413284 RepID=UPI003D27C202